MRILTSNLSFLWEEAMSALGKFGHCIVVSCVVLGEGICGGSFFLSLSCRPIRAVRFIGYILLYSCCISLNVIRS